MSMVHERLPRQIGADARVRAFHLTTRAERLLATAEESYVALKVKGHGDRRPGAGTPP